MSTTNQSSIPANTDSASGARVLRVDASMRKNNSVSRNLSDELVGRIAESKPATQIVTRDLTTGLPFVSEAWIEANFTDESSRTAEQRSVLAQSDCLVSELQTADILVIGVPIYNFGIPAALKAWVDMICRARLTFVYGDNGPVGQLKDKKAFLIIASGGTESGSDIDFATGYLQHVLGFVGIHDVTVIDASGLMNDEEASMARAKKQIKDIH